MAWKISESTRKSKEYQKSVQSLSLVHEGQGTVDLRKVISLILWCSINYVLDIVAYLFGIEIEYSTINAHRLAISTYHDYVENTPAGRHPGVSVLMTSLSNANPPKSKYVFIWDVGEVLSYVNNLPINEELSVI